MKHNKYDESRFKKILSSKWVLNTIKILAIAGVLGIVGYAIHALWPFISNFSNPESIELLKEKITSFEPYSWFILLGIQIMQIIVAIIPGEPVEILAGVMYGSIGGLIICMIGSLIGTILIFYIVKWLGKDLINKMFQSEKINKLKFLNSNKNIELLVGILFFIPGTPKDILTYFVPLTKIKPLRFFLISTFARIPSIITSTYAGATLHDGDFVRALVVFAVTAVIGVGGILIHNCFVEGANKKTKVIDEVHEDDK